MANINSYGKLTVVCGPMFASKTTHLLKQVLWAKNGQQRDVMVLKPAFDDRYALTEIVSHDNLRTPAESVNELPRIVWFDENLWSHNRGGLVVLDEVQFFTEPYVKGDVIAWVREALSNGTDIVVGGLDMDWQGHPFEITARLCGMADEVIKATANCTVCGRAARKTFKQSGDGGSVELGASDKYEARCNEHWR